MSDCKSVCKCGQDLPPHAHKDGEIILFCRNCNQRYSCEIAAAAGFIPDRREKEKTGDAE